MQDRCRLHPDRVSEADEGSASVAMTVPIALTIAGSDSSGGAGIQADLKTFAALGVYGASVITALTAQNTKGVAGIHGVPAEFVTAQMDAVFSDLDIAAVKIGMLGSAAVDRRRGGRARAASRPQRGARSGHGREFGRKAAAPQCAVGAARPDFTRARADAEPARGRGAARAWPRRATRPRCARKARSC